MSAAPSQIPSHVPADRVIDFDIAADEALKMDAFKRLAQVRDAAPTIAYTPRNGGHWLLFSRNTIDQVMQDGVTFSSAHLSAAGGQGGPGMIPLGIDPPDHAPWRHLLLKHFGPAQVKGLEPFARSWAEKLISKLDGATSCDFLKAVAEPMPVSIFMVIMGLPLERFDEFRGLVKEALNPPQEGEDMQARMANHMRIAGVLNELIEERRREPRDDLVSKLLAEEIKGRPLEHAELMSICFLLFLAGLDTVTNAMTYGMRHLAMHPEMQEEMRRDRSTIPANIEKMLRWYTFVNTHRIVTRDTMLDGVKIKKGEMVWCVLWAGSNDPAAEADVVRHTAFGGGHHMCLGMHLARLEIRMMYETWFDHIGPFTAVPDNGPTMRGGSVMNITRLMLNMEPLKAAA